MGDCALYFDDDFLKKRGGLYAEHTSPPRNMSEACCGYIIIAYVSHGAGVFHCGGAAVGIAVGDIVLINRGSGYRFSSDEGGNFISFYACVFDPSVLPYRLEDIAAPFKELNRFLNFKPGYIIVHDTARKDVRNTMIRIIDEYSYMQPGYKKAIICSVVTALTDLFRLYSAVGKNKVPDNHSHIVGYMLNYANRHIYKKCSLNEIAETLHMTPQYICKVFSDKIGMTFIEYCNDLRVKRIRDALEKTDRPLYLIYGDYDMTPRYLNRIFKKSTGYSISEYKKRFNYKAENPLYPK